jgi:hypothetical protein
LHPDFDGWGNQRHFKHGDYAYGPFTPPVTPRLKKEGIMLLTNNHMLFKLKVAGLPSKNPKDIEFTMLPYGANAEYAAKHHGDMYRKPVFMQINQAKFRKWYRLLDPDAESDLAKDRPEREVFKAARRSAQEWDEEILDFRFDQYPLHGPLRSWFDDSPLCLDDGAWRDEDAWKTRPYPTDGFVSDRLKESAKMYKMTRTPEQFAAAQVVKDRRAEEKAEDAARVMAKRHKSH